MIFGKKTYSVDRNIDLSRFLSYEDEVVASSIDQGHINVLVIHSAPKYRTENGMFAITKSEAPKDFTFLRFDFDGNIVVRTIIAEEYYNFHHACFLPSNEILLICGRCRFKSVEDVDKNARIYDLNGNLKRDFVAGDGIQDVKVNRKGLIWISYFDEGIFGNYGWEKPIGYPGLISWDNKGEKVWEFEPTGDLDHMADCYAMNIDSDDKVWFYYYTEFKVIKLNEKNEFEVWDCDLSGSSSINIANNRILMADGYDGDDFQLFEIGTKLKRKKKVKFKNQNGDELKKGQYVSSDGSLIGFFDKNQFYWIDLNELK